MNIAVRIAALLAVAALCACALPPAAVQPSTPTGPALSPPQLVTAVQRAADRIEQSKDPAERTRRLTMASADAQQCLAQAPDDGDCHYVWAQVQGLLARERPVQAVALLKDMLASLARAEALHPVFDHAGPARLTAVVLMRAPGWPLGPGDADAAVLAAQRAVALEPSYPPNLITLGQAQAKGDAAEAARASFAKARLAIQAWPTGPDEDPAKRAAWLRDLEQGSQALR